MMSGESLDRVHSRSLEVYLTEYRQRGGMSGILWNHCGPVGLFSCESYGDRGVMASVSFAGLLSNVESTETSPDSWDALRTISTAAGEGSGPVGTSLPRSQRAQERAREARAAPRRALCQLAGASIRFAGASI